MAKKQSALTNIIENGKPKLISSNVFTDEYKIKLDNITNPMQISGRVDTVDDLPTENVKIGDTYLVGLEGSAEFDEYVCLEDNPVKFENIGPVQKEELFERGEGVSSINAKEFGSYTEARRSVNVGYLNTINATAPESFAEGARNTIGNADDSGDCHESHVEGGGNQIVDGAYGSHAEGFLNTIEDGAYGSHAEGHGNTISGGTQYSHAEGINNKISEGAYASHVEGINNEIKGSAIATTVTGQQNTVDSYSSAVHGIGNEINGYVNFVFGTYNKTYKSTVSQQGYTTTYSSNNNIISGISNTVYGEIQSSILAGSNNNVYCSGRNAYNLFISGHTDFYPNGDGTFSLLTADSRNRNTVYGHNGFFHGNTIKITSTGGFNSVLNTYSSQIKDGVQFSNILGSSNIVISGSCEYSNVFNSVNSNIEAAVRFSSIIVSASSNIDSGSHHFNLILGSNRCNIKNLSNNNNFHSIISSDSSNITDSAGQFNTILGGSNHKIDSGATNAVIIYGNWNRINNGVDISGIFLGNHNLITNGSHRSLIFGGATNQITNAACDSIMINAFSSEIQTSTLNFISGNSNIIRGNYPTNYDASNFIFGDYNKIEPLNGSTVGHNVIFASGWIDNGNYRNKINGSYNFINGFAIATNESDWSTVLTSNFIDIYQKCNYSTLISTTQSRIGDTLDTLHPGNHFQFNAIVTSSYCDVSGETMYSNILNSSSSRIKGYYYKEEDLNNSSYYSQFNSILTGCSNEIDLSEWKKTWGGTDIGYNTIVGGISNKIKNAGTATIINGCTNNITDGVCYSTIINGCYNTINNGSQNNIILSGINNIITNGSYRSAIIAGYGNHIGENTHNSVVLGACNYLSGTTRSTFVEGEDNYIIGSTRNLHIEGVGHKSIYTSFSHIEGVGGLRLQFKEYDVNNNVYEIEFYDSSNSDITMSSYNYLIREGMYIAIGRTSVIDPGSGSAVKIETHPYWRSENQRSFYTVQLSKEIDVTKEWCLLEACTAYASHIEGVSNVNYGNIAHIEGQGNWNTAFLGHVSGQNNINYGELGVVYGCKNTNTSQMSTIFGSHNYVGGQYSLVVGCKNTTNYEAQYVFGIENTLNTSGNYQFVFGTKNTITGSCHNLSVFGVGLEIDSSAYSFIWGDGYAGSGDYIKNISFSSIMGVNHYIENVSYSNIFGTTNYVGNPSNSVYLTTVFGTANNIYGTSYGFISGTGNNVDNGRMQIIFGDCNSSYTSGGERLYMFGYGNQAISLQSTNYTSSESNFLFGDDNKIISASIDNTFLFGKKNSVEPIGNSTSAQSTCSMLTGYKNKAQNISCSFVEGSENTINSASNSIITGSFNEVGSSISSIISSNYFKTDNTINGGLVLLTYGGDNNFPYITSSALLGCYYMFTATTTGIENSLLNCYNPTIEYAYSTISVGSNHRITSHSSVIVGQSYNNQASNFNNTILNCSIVVGSEHELNQTFDSNNRQWFGGIAIFGINNKLNYTKPTYYPNNGTLIAGSLNRVYNSPETYVLGNSCKVYNANHSLITGYGHTLSNIDDPLGQISQSVVSGAGNKINNVTSSVVTGIELYANKFVGSFVTGSSDVYRQPEDTYRVYGEIVYSFAALNYIKFKEGSQTSNSIYKSILNIGNSTISYGSNYSVVVGYNLNIQYTSSSLIVSSNSKVRGSGNAIVGYDMNSRATDWEHTDLRGCAMFGHNNLLENTNESSYYMSNNLICGENNTMRDTGNDFSNGASLVSGSNNVVYNTQSSFVSGTLNKINNFAGSSILSGNNNTTNNLYSSLVIGQTNTITTSVSGSVLSGNNNTIDSASQALFSGSNNTINSIIQSVVNGYNNNITSITGACLIGYNFGKIDENEDISILTSIIVGTDFRFSGWNNLSTISGYGHTIENVTGAAIFGCVNKSLDGSSRFIMSGEENILNNSRSISMSGIGNRSINVTASSIEGLGVSFELNISENQGGYYIVPVGLHEHGLFIQDIAFITDDPDNIDLGFNGNESNIIKITGYDSLTETYTTNKPIDLTKTWYVLSYNSGIGIHTEGITNSTSGNASHTEGKSNITFGNCSYTSGCGNINNADYSYVFSLNSLNRGNNSAIISGCGNTNTFDNVVMINCNNKVAEKSDVTYIRNIDTNEIITDKKYTNVIVSNDDNIAPTLEELTEMLIVNLTSNMTVVTLPTMPNNKSITINVKVIQDNIGNRDLMFESEDFAPVNNPDNVDFTIGNSLERCMVTLIWDSEEWWLSSTKYVQAQGTPF